ncbi:MAG: hypothetical protein ACRDF4_06405 [Rhabdochlamydiaceae bacterium]
MKLKSEKKKIISSVLGRKFVLTALLGAFLIFSISVPTIQVNGYASRVGNFANPSSDGSIALAGDSTATNSTYGLPHTNLNASDFNVPTFPAVPVTTPGTFLTPNGVLARNVTSPTDTIASGSPNLPIGSGNQIFNITSASSYVKTSLSSISDNQMLASSCHTSPCTSFNSFASPQWSDNYCTSSSSCTVISVNTPGDLLIASGSCPSSVSSFTDSLGDQFTTSISSSVSSVGVAIAYSILTSSGSNTITMRCGSSGTIGIEYGEVNGFGTSFDTFNSTGTCTSGCSASLHTSSSVTIPAGTNYFAVGVAYASPGYGLATPGSGFTANEPLYNPLQASEYSTSVGSSTNFPITDATTPSVWIDAGVVFVENKQFSYQLNMVIPNCSGCTPTQHNFMSQSVMEFDLVRNYCYANNAHVVSFSCSQADQSGDYFEWTIQSSSNYFTSTSLYLNGNLLYTWTSSQIFGCSSCASMTDAYLQSVWVGWGSYQQQYGTYANFYDGQGTMTYSGVSLGNFGPGGTGWVVTGETSNNQFSTPTLSGGLYSQTSYAATVGQTLLGYSTCSGSTLNNPSDILGVPDGLSADYIALSSGGCAQTSSDFGGTPSTYAGNLAIYGYSDGLSSSLDVYCGTSLVFSGSWTTSVSNQPSWIRIGSVSSCQGVTIDTVYQAHIYIDALSLYN